MYLYAIDGDDIGKKIELALFNDDLDRAREISLALNEKLEEINSYLRSCGAETIFLGGDSVLLKASNLIKLPVDLLNDGAYSFSVGIAKSPSEALLALKKAKGLGKNRIVKL